MYRHAMLYDLCSYILIVLAWVVAVVAVVVVIVEAAIAAVVVDYVRLICGVESTPVWVYNNDSNQYIYYTDIAFGYYYYYYYYYC